MISLNTFTKICHCDLSLTYQFLGEETWARLHLKLLYIIRKGECMNDAKLSHLSVSAYHSMPPRATYCTVQLGEYKPISSHTQTFVCSWRT